MNVTSDRRLHGQGSKPNRKDSLMPEKANRLQEQISHTTNSSPYSIHYTGVSSDTVPALYLHWHNEMEFLYLVEGELLFQIENHSFRLHAKEGIFIPPGLLHTARNIGASPISFYALVFSPDFLISSFDTHSYHSYILPVMHNSLQFSIAFSKAVPWQKEILDFLHNIFFAKNRNELYIRGLALLIWDTLYQNHISKIAVPKSVRTLSVQLAPAITYIQEKYQQSVSLEELAATVHLSEGQFCRNFKHLTGMTPFHYLIRYRILQSCNELSNTDKKITDIATSHGFNNISYYNRAFLQLMNMTPSQYRKRI